MPDQELIGLGAVSIAASFSGGYPITGGFIRYYHQAFSRQSRKSEEIVAKMLQVDVLTGQDF